MPKARRPYLGNQALTIFYYFDQTHFASVILYKMEFSLLQFRLLQRYYFVTVKTVHRQFKQFLFKFIN